MERKVVLSDVPPVPEEIENPDVLAAYIAHALDLIPRRGKGDVAVKLIKIFAAVAGKRDENVVIGGKTIHIYSGSLKVEDIRHWLATEGVEIGLSQLYSTYIARFMERGLIVKRKHSTYGLRAERLSDTIAEIARDAQNIAEKLRDHARRLDKALSKKR